MASLRKHARSQNWYACITLPDGRQRQFSTGTAVEADALAIAQAAETATRRHGSKPHALRASLGRLMAEFAPDELAQAKPAAWVRDWAKGRTGEVAAGTLTAYTTTATEVADWLEAAGIKSFLDVTGTECRALRDHWVEANSPMTVNKKLKHLRQILGAAVPRYLASNPAVGVPEVRTVKTVRREFSDVEMAAVLARLGREDAESREWLAMVWLGLNTGQRMNDLAELPARGLDLEAKTVTFHAAKTGALVCLPLLEKTVVVLKALPRPLDASLPVFPTIAAMAHSTRSNAFRAVLVSIGLAKKAPKKKRGTPSKKRTTSELSFHSLRHTATTWLKSAGVADSIARAIIGHESVAVSRSYTHFDMATMREAMAKVERFQA